MNTPSGFTIGIMKKSQWEASSDRMIWLMKDSKEKLEQV